MAVDGAFTDQVVDDGGNVALALFLVDSLFEEIREVDFNLLEKALRKAPEVHRDDGVIINEAGRAI